ncbi:hypothetical protein GQ602_002159 [Ophiocordyceps camponoti-floridani]|uniref:Uncharacterized protein n=1 Tax=Ophiocordyceps camponoti-floridani TaxID=2030778 RepID=A0A8H4Q9V5_9HYPO|nr:hypothetical protein GQ602_002159 [Ophiocordyceps camponoti-floridani]
MHTGSSSAKQSRTGRLEVGSGLAPVWLRFVRITWSAVSAPSHHHDFIPPTGPSPKPPSLPPDQACLSPRPALSARQCRARAPDRGPAR